ncbi:hypothetical protein [Streptomyces paradoxus]|uniref:hypothetical protein n=1 Tax=Streptomyces paradoxus TaxID=66375 RepID=UPI0037F628C5
MSLIVGVHGIGQQQRGRRQLLQTWLPALGDGLELACGRLLPAVPLGIAFYGDVFLPEQPAATSKGAQEEALAGLGEEELDDLVAAAKDAVGEEAWHAVADLGTKGRLPRGGQMVLRAVNWRFGPGAGLLFVGVFRQVRRYLRDTAVKERVDRAVATAVGDNCRVLLGHSLGSVVAFEYLRSHPGRELDLLVTLGSPLGARFVRALMPDPGHGAGGLPPGVRTWVNVRDARDPVAVAPLEHHWKGVEEAPLVDNGADAHAVTRYLGKCVTGEVILRALPELLP